MHRRRGIPKLGELVCLQEEIELLHLVRPAAERVDRQLRAQCVIESERSGPIVDRPLEVPERPISIGLHVVHGRGIAVEVSRRDVLGTLHIGVRLVAESEVGAQPLRESELRSSYARKDRCLARPVLVVRQEIPKAVFRHVDRIAPAKDEEIHEARVVTDVRQDVREVPVVCLSVIRKVGRR